MNSARIALAALATLGSGILLGLAANPTMRTFPEMDWRERYRAMTTDPATPPPQPGVSYYGDGSTAWVYGAVPARFSDGPAFAAIPPWRDPPAYQPGPLPEPIAAPLRDDFDAQASAAARTAAQAAVADALLRSAPSEDRQPDAAKGAEPGGGEQGGAIVPGSSPGNEPAPEQTAL